MPSFGRRDPSLSEVRRCPRCGAPLSPAAPYCTRCGQPYNPPAADPARWRRAVAVLTQRQSWSLFLLAVVPILLEALRLDVISGMMIYFSLFWFFLFRRLTHAHFGPQALAADVLAYGVSATVGVGLAVALESLAVAMGAASLIQSPRLATAITGSVLYIGLVEEFAKQLWVMGLAAYHRLRRRARPPVTYLMVGIVSGLGFSAVENIDYVKRGIFLDLSQHVAGVGTLTALSRALYTPFLHALWAGIAAYAIGVAVERHRLRYALAGLVGAGTLHGLYDACIHTNTLAGLAVVAVSYLVFLAIVAWGATPTSGAAASS